MSGDLGERVLPAMLLQPGTDAPMQLPATRQQQAAVGNLVHERMAHDEATVVGRSAAVHHEIPTGQVAEGRLHVEVRLDRRQQALGEVHAAHRRDLERGAGLGGQRVDAGQQELVHRLRQSLGRAVRIGPAAAQELLEEERVAAGPMQELGRLRVVHGPCRRERTDQLLGVGGAQSAEVDLLVVAPAGPRILPAGPIQEQDRERMIRDEAEQLVEHRDARRIGPVEVVEDQELRPFRNPAPKDRPERLDQQPLPAGRARVAEHFPLLGRRRAAQVVQRRGPQVSRVVVRARAIDLLPCDPQLRGELADQVVREGACVGRGAGPGRGEAIGLRPRTDLEGQP